MFNLQSTFPLLGALILACCSREAPPCPPAEPEPEISVDIEPFLTSYFATWSAGDMEGYRDHFHPRAVISLVKSGRIISSLPRDPFVAGQKASREHSEHPGIERMTSFHADEDRQAATVRAEWELVQGEERTIGVDRFTLIRDEQWQWKIISLLFYSTDRGRSDS